jgi:hypothetical protein
MLTPGERRGEVNATLRGELMAILDLAAGRGAPAGRSSRVITNAVASPRFEPTSASRPLDGRHMPLDEHHSAKLDRHNNNIRVHCFILLGSPRITNSYLNCTFRKNGFAERWQVVAATSHRKPTPRPRRALISSV